MAHIDKNETGYAYQALRNAEKNEIIHEQTMQRRFERSFESRDWVGSRAYFADPGDRGACVRGIVRNLDAGARTARHEYLVRCFALRLPCRANILRSLLWGIYRNGTDRHLTMMELGIAPCTYWHGILELRKYLRTKPKTHSRRKRKIRK